MIAEEKLEVLKCDLQLLTSANDVFLKKLLSQAEDAIKTEGITLIEDDISCDMIVISYAAYLFRKRASAETTMPRFLRYQLNNILFKQKGGAL